MADDQNTEEKVYILNILSHYLNRSWKQDLLEKNKQVPVPLLLSRHCWDLPDKTKQKSQQTHLKFITEVMPMPA